MSMRLLLAAVSLTLGFALSSFGGPVATFQGIGQLGGFVFTTAHAVSGDGSTVVGTAFDETGSQAFRWTKAAGIQSLGPLDGQPARSFGLGVSGDGSVVVGRAEQPDRVRPFRWTAASGMTALVDEPGELNAISPDGSTPVGMLNSKAVSWVLGGPLLVPGATDGSNAFGVSGDGSVVVGSNNGQAFRATDLASQPLGVFAGDANSVARDITPDGKVIVGATAGGNSERAARWNESLVIELLTDPSVNSAANAVSADGKTIVGRSINGAFIWTAGGGFQDLQALLDSGGADLTGWTLAEAFDVSADGRTIVGEGRNPRGDTEGWIATLPASSGTVVPLPNPLAAEAAGLAAAGLVVVVSASRRTSRTMTA